MSQISSKILNRFKTSPFRLLKNFSCPLLVKGFGISIGLVVVVVVIDVVVVVVVFVAAVDADVVVAVVVAVVFVAIQRGSNPIQNLHKKGKFCAFEILV